MRRWKPIPVLAACAILATGGIVRAEMYQYSDDNGVQHYVDSESKIPAKYRRGASLHAPKGDATHPVHEQPTQAKGLANPADPAPATPSADPAPETLPQANPAKPDTAHTNGPDFWKRRRKLLEEKIRNLTSDCQYWKQAKPPESVSAARAAARERGLKQCDELARAQRDLDSLPAEIRKQGGNAAWISD